MTDEKADLSGACPADPPDTLNFEHGRIRTDTDLAAFLDDVDDRVEDISTSYKESLWRTYFGEEAEDFKQLEERLLTITTSHNLLEFMKHWRLRTADPVCRRRLEVWQHELEKTQVEFDHRIHGSYSSYVQLMRDFRFERGSDSFSLEELLYRLATEPDAAERAWSQMGLVEFSAKAAPVLMELVRARNESAVNFGYQDYPSLGLAYLDVDWKEARESFDEFCTSTHAEYETIRQEAAANLHLKEWLPSDLLWVSHALYDASLDTAVPFAVAAESILRFVKGLGADLDHLAISTREAPSEFSAMTIPISVPDDIRIMIPNADGYRRAVLLGREYGRALYYASVDQSCYALRGVNEILLETCAGLFGDAVAEPALWRDDPSRADSAKAFHRYHRGQTLLETRIFMALSEFEVRVYTESASPDGLWQEIVSRYLGFENVQTDWAAQNILVTRPFYALQLALARVLARRIGGRVADLNENDRMKFLTQHVFRHGNRIPWRDVVANTLQKGSA